MDANLAAFDALHRNLIDELFHHDHAQRVRQIVAGYGDQLRGSCHALCALGLAAPPETSDLLLALGEKISACILANYLCQAGVEAQFIKAEDVITTDGSFGNAVPDMEATRRNCDAHVLTLLDRLAVPVIAGYTGATTSGQTTTLGRGGSDYSATTIAAATASERDPRVQRPHVAHRHRDRGGVARGVIARRRDPGIVEVDARAQDALGLGDFLCRDALAGGEAVSSSPSPTSLRRRSGMTRATRSSSPGGPPSCGGVIVPSSIRVS